MLQVGSGKQLSCSRIIELIWVRLGQFANFGSALHASQDEDKFLDNWKGCQELSRHGCIPDGFDSLVIYFSIKKYSNFVSKSINSNCSFQICVDVINIYQYQTNSVKELWLLQKYIF